MYVEFSTQTHMFFVDMYNTSYIYIYNFVYERERDRDAQQQQQHNPRYVVEVAALTAAGRGPWSEPPFWRVLGAEGLRVRSDMQQ